MKLKIAGVISPMIIRAIVFLSLLGTLLSCGTGEHTGFQVTAGTNGTVFVRSGARGRPVFEILNTSGDVSGGFLADVARSILGSTDRWSGRAGLPDDTVRVEFDGNLYRLYVQLAANSTLDMKNDLIRFGLMQNGWLEWIETAVKQDGWPKRFQSEMTRIFRIPDLDEWVRVNCPERREREQVYPYAVSYLLREILYVSVQELLSRPPRYFNIREIETPFLQLVSLPEAAEWTTYLAGKFGAGKTLEAARSEFSTARWKGIFGEEIHETEGDFSRDLEQRKFGGVFADPDKIRELNGLLKLYNRLTKSTLFRKT